MGGDGLGQARQMLVRRWGEMGGYWGISRTMAEIHALLFVSERPLCTDEIMAELKISRGSASTNLRSLVDWGLVQRVHKLGDRKEYFQAESDVWRMFETIMRERRRREVEPILATLDRCCEMVRPREADRDDAAQVFRQRVQALRDFLATMGQLFELVLRFGPDGTRRLGRVLSAARRSAKGPGKRPAARRRSRG